MKSRIFAVVTAILLVFTLTAPAASTAGRARALTASEWIVPEGYNEHDYNAVASFLEQTDAEGVKNGFKLNPNYDPNDPNTWFNDAHGSNECGVFFGDYDGEQRLWMIALRQFGFCGNIDLSNCPLLEMGTFENGNIVSADFSNCPNLSYVCISNNRDLDCLRVDNCQAITMLFCDRTSIRELDVGTMTALEGLFCYETQITDLDVSNCTALRDLVCQANDISFLDLSNCNQLMSAACDGCALEEIILPANSNVTNLVLNCTSNKLMNIDLSNSSCLSALYCADNSLKELDLSSCINLRSLDCSVNELTEIDTSFCPSLSQLYCTDNRITQFDFSSNPELALDFIIAEGNGTIGYGYQSMYGELSAYVFAQPDEGNEFVGWYNEAGEQLSADKDFDFSSLIGSEPGLIARFAEKTVVPGDANGDGAVDTEDALLVLRAALGIGGDPEALLEGCDMDENGAIDTTDALLILRLALGIS